MKYSQALKSIKFLSLLKRFIIEGKLQIFAKNLLFASLINSFGLLHLLKISSLNFGNILLILLIEILESLKVLLKLPQLSRFLEKVVDLASQPLQMNIGRIGLLTTNSSMSQLDYSFGVQPLVPEVFIEHLLGVNDLLLAFFVVDCFLFSLRILFFFFILFGGPTMNQSGRYLLLKIPLLRVAVALWLVRCLRILFDIIVFTIL